MPPVITCPECEKKFKGKPELKGKKIRCPKCEYVFVVKVIEGLDEEEASPVQARAKAPAKAVAPAPPAAPTRGAAISGSTDEEDGLAYGIGIQDLRARCPICANPMESEEAVVCLSCGYNTQTRLGARTIKTHDKTLNDYLKHLWPGLLALVLNVLIIVFLLWSCTVLPYQLTIEWYSFIGHESIRLWNVIGWLFTVWSLGFLAYHRLIINPVPGDKLKDDKPKDGQGKQPAKDAPKPSRAPDTRSRKPDKHKPSEDEEDEEEERPRSKSALARQLLNPKLSALQSSDICSQFRDIGAAGIAALKEILRSREAQNFPQVRMNAVKALAYIGKAAIPTMITVLCDDDDDDVQSYVCTCLQDMGDAAASALRPLLEHDRDSVRKWARLTLKNLE